MVTYDWTPRLRPGSGYISCAQWACDFLREWIFNHCFFRRIIFESPEPPFGVPHKADIHAVPLATFSGWTILVANKKFRLVVANPLDQK